MSETTRRRGRLPALLASLAAGLLLTACERPPMESAQQGYRGTGMENVVNPRIRAELVAVNQPPAEAPAIPAGGPKASEAYKNVQVLGDLDVGSFTRLMVAMSNWIAPKEQCAYCHKPGEDYSDDSLYTKVVARRMIQMTQAINRDWKPHVADTGVNCYTCHRGQGVPAAVWSKAEPHKQADRMVGTDGGQNSPMMSVALSSLPYDPFTPYLSGNEPIRVIGKTALPTGNDMSIQSTEGTYALMMHMSQALGVNCTACHNSRAFGSWEQSPPQRVTSWYGIRMAREVNNEYMDPLVSVFPDNRKGPMGDVLKVNCTTCHQGANKPLLGARMVDGHPELVGK